ncbi:MAG: hypothetical protein ACTSW1_01275 [Candidatus Hodarchaeales archaeon]
MSIQAKHTKLKKQWKEYFKSLGYIDLPRKGKGSKLGFRPDIFMIKANVPFGEPSGGYSDYYKQRGFIKMPSSLDIIVCEIIRS